MDQNHNRWSKVAGYRTHPFFFGPEEVCQSAIQSDDSFTSYRGNRRRQRQRQQTDRLP